MPDQLPLPPPKKKVSPANDLPLPPPKQEVLKKKSGSGSGVTPSSSPVPSFTDRLDQILPYAQDKKRLDEFQEQEKKLPTLSEVLQQANQEQEQNLSDQPTTQQVGFEGYQTVNKEGVKTVVPKPMQNQQQPSLSDSQKKYAGTGNIEPIETGNYIENIIPLVKQGKELYEQATKGSETPYLDKTEKPKNLDITETPAIVQNTVANTVADMLTSIAATSKQLNLFGEYDEKKVDDLATYKIAEGLRAYSQYFNPVSDESQESFGGKVVQGATSLGLFVLGGMASKSLKLGQMAVPALMGATQNGGSEYRIALNKVRDAQELSDEEYAAKYGTTEGKQELAQQDAEQVAFDTFIGASAIGSLEALPVGSYMKRLDGLTGGLFHKAVGKYLSGEIGATGQAVMGAIEEGSEEAISQYLTNLNAREVYDQTRNIYEGVAESGMLGGLLGGTLNGLSAALRTKRADPNNTQSDIEIIDKSIEYVDTKKEELQSLGKQPNDFVTIGDSKAVADLKQQKNQLESDLANPNISADIKQQIQDKVAEIDQQIAQTKAEEIKADGDKVEADAARNELMAQIDSLGKQLDSASPQTKELIQQNLNDLTAELDTLNAQTARNNEEVNKPQEYQANPAAPDGNVRLKNALQDVGAPSKLMEAIPDTAELRESFLADNKDILSSLLGLQGVYNRKTDEIGIGKFYSSLLGGRKRVLVHEAVHAATIKTFQDMLQNPDSYTKEQVKAANDINNIAWEYLTNTSTMSKLTIPTLYGTTNPLEFIAEFVSNKNFREWVSKNNPTKKTSIASYFWDKILNMLGLKKHQINSELINNIERGIDSIFDAQISNINKKRESGQLQLSPQEESGSPQGQTTSPLKDAEGAEAAPVAENKDIETTDRELSDKETNFVKDLKDKYGALPKRLPPQAERERLKGQRGLLEATIVAERSLGSNEAPEHQQNARPAIRQERALEKYAKENGLWVEDYRKKFGELAAVGLESEVYLNPDNSTVTKVNSGVQYFSPLDFFDSLTIWNYLFPETAYTLKGFTKVNGRLGYILEQPFIKSEGGADIDSVKADLNKIGFDTKNFTRLKGAYHPGLDIWLRDLHNENAVISNGTVKYIDAVVDMNTEEKGTGGKKAIEPTVYKQEEEPEGKKLKLATRVLESENVDDDIKEGLKKEGVTYIPENLKVNQEEAQAYVSSFEEAGQIDKALENVMDLNNRMKGLTRGAIGAELFNRYSKLARESTSIEQKRELDLKAAKIAKFAAVQLKEAGQEINAGKIWKRMLENSPEGAISALNEQYNENNAPILEKHKGEIRDAKKILEDYLKTEEGQAVIREEVDKEIEKKGEALLGKEQKKKISDFFDSLLINTKGKLYDASFALPVAVYNGAIKAVKQATLLGVDAANAIKAGIDFVTANHKGPWKQKEFELMLTKGLKGMRPRQKVKVPQKVLDQWDKRLSKMKPENRKKLLAQSIEELNNTGALSDERFKEFYAEALGLPTLTDEVKADIFSLIGRINEAETAADEYKKALDGTDKNEVNKTRSKWQQAVRDARNANEQLSQYFRGPKKLGETLTTIMQGNLLTPMSLVTNIYSNILFQPLRFASGGVASISDYILSQGAKYTALGKLLGKERTIDLLARSRGAYKGIIPGIKEGIEDFRHGLTSEEIKQRDLNNKLQPFKEATKLWTTYFGDNKMSAKEQVNAWAEATIGIPADLFFKLLNFGDKPFRRMAEFGKAYEIAQKKGLKGNELEKFLEFPDEASAEEIKAAGDEATFQKDNKAVKVFNQISSNIKEIPVVGDSLNFLFKALFPYVKTPSNILAETFNYALPPVTMMRSVYHASKGQRKEALDHFGKAVVGSMISYAVYQLLINGLLTGDGKDDSSKERAAQYENIPPNSLNLTAMTRGFSGQGFKPSKDDVWINYQKTGIIGSLMGMYANMGNDKTQEDLRKIGATDVFLKGAPSLFKSTFDQSYLSGTSALFDAMKEGGDKVDKLIVNMTNTISSTAYPNTLSALSRSSDTNVRNLKGEDLGEDIKNMFMNKMFMGDKLPSKVTLWGQKASNAPQGRDKYMYNLFDVTKYRHAPDNFGFKIYDMWNKTKDSEWLPSIPKNDFAVENGKTKLTPSQYEQFLILVGTKRKELVEPYVNSESWNEDNDQMKLKILGTLYDQGRDLAKQLFLEQYDTDQRE